VPNPQQHVREVGQAVAPAAQPQAGGNTGYGINDGAIGGAGTENTQTEQSVKEIRERYEQQISAWIERHKFYPADAGGREGRVVVRMRIDHSGVVRYYAIEKSSGVTAIDAAAIDMIRRANPVPPVPYNYSVDPLIEFLVPINIQVQQ
jgi:protein TonB